MAAQATHSMRARSDVSDRQVAAVILMAAGWGWISGNFVDPFLPFFFGWLIDLVHFVPAAILLLLSMHYFRVSGIEVRESAGSGGAHRHQRRRRLLHPRLRGVRAPRDDQPGSQFSRHAYDRGLATGDRIERRHVPLALEPRADSEGGECDRQGRGRRILASWHGASRQIDLRRLRRPLQWESEARTDEMEVTERGLLDVRQRMSRSTCAVRPVPTSASAWAACLTRSSVNSVVVPSAPSSTGKQTAPLRASHSCRAGCPLRTTGLAAQHYE
jgi:hypothetical protein